MNTGIGREKEEYESQEGKVLKLREKSVNGLSGLGKERNNTLVL